MNRSELERISPFIWEIPQSTREDMRVPVRIFASESHIDSLLQHRTTQQLINVATLPGIQRAVMAMPDAQVGFGFPIGSVAAMDYSEGIITPAGIGHDINSGVRLMAIPETYESIKKDIAHFVHELSRRIPKRMGRDGDLQLTTTQLNSVLEDGAKWAVKHGYGLPIDLDHIESKGCMTEAESDLISDQAKKRGFDQLGTLGNRNHFIEVHRIASITNKTIADAFGLFDDQIVVVIHSGSGGLGHQVTADYIDRFNEAMPTYNLKPSDHELACAPFHSPPGQHFFKAMCAAANYAWCNRQILGWEVRQACKAIFGHSEEQIPLLYDASHNLACIETHRIDGTEQKLIVHRKGTTRSFGAGNQTLSPRFKTTGQPVVIPGNLDSPSYILVGSRSSGIYSFGSCSAGVNREPTHTQDSNQGSMPQNRKELQSSTIIKESASFAGVKTSTKTNYDIQKVVDIVCNIGLAGKVATLQPVGFIKG